MAFVDEDVIGNFGSAAFVATDETTRSNDLSPDPAVCYLTPTGLGQGWINQFCSGFCFVHGVVVVRPTVKTMGYYRSAPFPLGREGNSVPDGVPKIAFFQGIGLVESWPIFLTLPR